MRIQAQAETFAYRSATNEPPLGLTFKVDSKYGGPVSAYVDGKHAGQLSWWHPGMWRDESDPMSKYNPDPVHVPHSVSDLQVHPDFRRQGIATALFNHVKQNVYPDLIHSNEVTDAGAGFAESMGHRPPSDKRLLPYGDR
jgi:GNAT superfamily N-acetyltransferase